MSHERSNFLVITCFSNVFGTLPMWLKWFHVCLHHMYIESHVKCTFHTLSHEITILSHELHVIICESTISHMITHLDLNRGLPHGKPNICQSAKGEPTLAKGRATVLHNHTWNDVLRGDSLHVKSIWLFCKGYSHTVGILGSEKV